MPRSPTHPVTMPGARQARRITRYNSKSPVPATVRRYACILRNLDIIERENYVTHLLTVWPKLLLELSSVIPESGVLATLFPTDSVLLDHIMQHNDEKRMRNASIRSYYAA